MTGQSPAAAGESAATTTPQQQPIEGSQPQQTAAAPAAAPPSRLGEILANLELPADVVATVTSQQPTDSSSQQQPQPAGSSNQPGAPNEPGQPAAGAQTQSGSDGQQPQQQQQSGDEPTPEGWDQWPDSARAQVLEARRKLRERTAELNRVKAQQTQAPAGQQPAQPNGQQPQQQPAQPQQPQQPTQQQSPAPAIHAAPGSALASVETEINRQAQLLSWANSYVGQGAYDIVTGKDEQGNEKREDFPPDRIAHLVTAAQIKLSELQSQRTAMVTEAQRAYAVMAEQTEAEVRRDYPDFYNEDTELHQTAAAIFVQMPEIQRFADWKIFLAAAAKLQLDRSKQAAGNNDNGNGNGHQQPNGQQFSPVVQAFLKPQPKIPPTPPTVRSAAPADSSDVDVNKARENVIAQHGDDAAMEQFIAATRKAQSGNRGAGGRAPALV